MPFTDLDREKLVQVHTDVAWIKSEHGQRLDNLESEDKILHHRINKVRNIYIGATAALTALAGGITAWVKTQITGGN